MEERSEFLVFDCEHLFSRFVYVFPGFFKHTRRFSWFENGGLSFPHGGSNIIFKICIYRGARDVFPCMFRPPRDGFLVYVSVFLCVFPSTLPVFRLGGRLSFQTISFELV